MPVCQPSADEISHREVDEYQADDARPNQVAGAKDIAQQPGGGHLQAQGGHSRDEDDEVEAFGGEDARGRCHREIINQSPAYTTFFVFLVEGMDGLKVF